MLLCLNVISEAADEKAFAETVIIPNGTELNIAKRKILRKKGTKMCRQEFTFLCHVKLSGSARNGNTV